MNTEILLLLDLDIKRQQKDIKPLVWKSSSKGEMTLDQMDTQHIYNARAIVQTTRWGSNIPLNASIRKIWVAAFDEELSKRSVIHRELF
jgi:hypothetical protein